MLRKFATVPCEACGEPFKKTRPNRKYCEDCEIICGNTAWRNLPGLERGYDRLVAKLNAQVKVYRAEEYSQKFLRGLIPNR